MPPKKKVMAEINTNSLPRVRANLAVTALRAECKLRGFKTAGCWTKQECLQELRLGSIHVAGTQEFVRLEAIKAIMQREEHDEKQRALQKEAEEKKRRREEEEQRASAAKKQRMVQRAEEMKAQVHLHSALIPQVHGCALALTSSLKCYGSPRLGICWCSNGSQSTSSSDCNGDVMYTCEQCDFDICTGCFKVQTMTAEEKKAREAKIAAEEAERLRNLRMRAQERRRMMEEMQKERRRRTEEKQKEWIQRCERRYQVKFTEGATNPSSIHRNSRQKQAFVVWSSDGYPPDGFHSYAGPPKKEFDASFPTLEEANARALYLFHVKNPWGLDVDEVENQDISASRTQGALKFVCCPADSTEWTVGVVPLAAFAHL